MKSVLNELKQRLIKMSKAYNKVKKKNLKCYLKSLFKINQ